MFYILVLFHFTIFSINYITKITHFIKCYVRNIMFFINSLK